MKNTILILVTVVAIGASAYLWYSYAGAPAQPALERTSATDQASAEIKDLLAILQTLQSIKIDAAYLDDPNFKMLIDFAPSTAVPSEKGRPNPFVPASASNAYVAQTKSTGGQ
ncbi:MAG: hypothetical protein HZA25_03010 [Candidatus Niyogibacteria bacterium]|nr:hypothetical protein [Candidatus Niyogibacteria bacterium]